MQPLGFAMLLAGALLLVAGVTGSSFPSVAKGAPDKSRAGGPQVPDEPGGAVAGATVLPSERTPNARGLFNPTPGFTIGRTDMGVDLSAKPGAPIYAIAPGKVLGIIHNWYSGQPFLYYEVTSGVLKGRVIYVAEQIIPLVNPGQTIAGGQQIARYAPTGTGIEEGYGTRSGRTLAQATTGYVEGQITAAGQSFHDLLTRL